MATNLTPAPSRRRPSGFLPLLNSRPTGTAPPAGGPRPAGQSGSLAAAEPERVALPAVGQRGMMDSRRLMAVRWRCDGERWRSMTVLYRPGEAGRAVGVKPSTLRVYVQRFSDLLSDDATAAERPGYRLFTERDVTLLKQA